MTNISVDSVSHSYGGEPALDQVSFSVGDAELVALLGPSGCGKTTLLRMIAGLVPTSEGKILLGETDISRQPPYRRNLGMVFQNYALFPHMTVMENVAFGLNMRKIPIPDQKARIDEVLRLVRLESYAQRYPRQLSGGQQQRVAIARALVIHPEAFLLARKIHGGLADVVQAVEMA
jgi:putative spermidine/putrescine transport system ATP-binding protein